MLGSASDILVFEKQSHLQELCRWDFWEYRYCTVRLKQRTEALPDVAEFMYVEERKYEETDLQHNSDWQ